jgi:hypothetical protein
MRLTPFAQGHSILMPSTCAVTKEVFHFARRSRAAWIAVAALVLAGGGLFVFATVATVATCADIDVVVARDNSEPGSSPTLSYTRNANQAATFVPERGW